MRKLVLTLTLLLAGLASPVLAGTLAEAVAAELDAKGYSEVRVVRSWLGRIIITAELDGRVREITINPKTGEILRDFFRSAPVETSSSSESGAAVTVASPDENESAVSSTDSDFRTSGEGMSGPLSSEGILIDSLASEGRK